MSEQDYHHKLAEVIEKCLRDNTWQRADEQVKSVADLVTAVLASEGVVDPAFVEQTVTLKNVEISCLHTEVERLEAGPINTAAQAKAIDASITVAYYNGMEAAAKMVGVVAEVEGEHIRTTIAAAIRAEIKGA